MQEPRFQIKTTMTKADYRKFLYLATFFRSWLVLPLLMLLAFVGSVVIGAMQGFSCGATAVLWLVLVAFSAGVICFKVERKNAQRIKTDHTGSFDSENELDFYEDHITMENAALKSRSELGYAQFYLVMESREYFIFYLTMNQAALLRKRDVEDCEAFRRFLQEKFKEKYRRMPYGV